MAVEFKIPATVIPSLAVKEDINVIATLTANSITIDSLGSTVKLNKILKSAELLFIANNQGFTQDATVPLWTNTGTLGSIHNAVSGGTSSRDPIYDKEGASNPFAGSGALYFTNENAAIPTFTDYLSLSNRYTSPSGPATMFVVAAYEAGHTPSQPPTIGEVYHQATGFPDVLGNPEAALYSGKLMEFSNKDSLNSFKIYDKDTKISTYGVQFDLQTSSMSEPFGDGTAEIFVLRRVANGDVYLYNGFTEQVGFIASGTSTNTEKNPSGWKMDMDGFGRSKNYERNPFLSAYQLADGKGVYIAAFGVIPEDLGSQKTLTFARLLKDRYVS
jgi:hypothetical protein